MLWFAPAPRQKQQSRSRLATAALDENQERGTRSHHALRRLIGEGQGLQLDRASREVVSVYTDQQLPPAPALSARAVGVAGVQRGWRGLPLDGGAEPGGTCSRVSLARMVVTVALVLGYRRRAVSTKMSSAGRS